MTSPWARQALAAGGHLGDDVAYVIVDEAHSFPEGELEKRWAKANRRIDGLTLAQTLVSDDDALD